MEAEAAITRFCIAELRAAAKRMVHRLRRDPATGIYGHARSHRTLWDELQFEATNGPTGQLESAWQAALQPHASGIVASMAPHTQALLSWHLASLELADPDDGIDEQAICEAICLSLKCLAMEG